MIKWFRNTEEKQKPAKGDFVVVLHNWFGAQAKGFEQIILKDVTIEEANNKGYEMVGKKHGTFNHVAFTIVEWMEN